jgi:hypothetical protein
LFIKGYEFGRIIIGGETYTKDVIIYPDRVQAAWRRRNGHRLDMEDLKDVLAEKPDILIIGTGSSGLMSVPAETLASLQSRGIDVFSYRTADAVKLYNSTPKSYKIVAALHLTC